MSATCRGGRLATSLCVLVAAAQMVAGKPHRCFLDDYARALLGQYDPAATAYDGVRDEPRAFRSGRSYGPEEWRGPAVTVPVLEARPDADPSYPSPAGRYVAHSELGADASEEPCKTAGQPAGGDNTVNGTGPAAIVQKLAAYYELLKSQQEALARQQLQHQLYEQQRQRQQEYMLVQQQIQQQYYQQQQHALRMLEQLRKNPEFANQLAAFIDRKRAEDANNNGTASTVPVTEAKEAAAETMGQQRLANKIDRAGIGEYDHSGSEEKRPNTKQTAAAAADDDDEEQIDDDRTPFYYND